MKLKDNEKMLIMIAVGLAAAILSIVFIAKPNYEATQSLNTEILQLQDRLALLNEKQAHREEYIADTAKFNEEFEEKLNAFPADMNQEITVMFLDGIKTDNDFGLASLELGEKEQFYTLGQGGAAASLDTTGTEAPAEDAGTESADTAAAEPEGDATGELAEGVADAGDSAYNCYRAAFPIQYHGSYDSLKNVVYYVGNYSDRMTINSMDITYDAENDVYNGDLDLYCYSIESPDRPERQIELNEVETGVDNIFNTGATAGGSGDSSGLNKYDENDGAAIESSYDFYAMLNPATSDVSAKVVGQNGAGKEASVISNSDNSASTIDFEFYEKDGKNYCKYTLDNSTSYEAEVTSAEDIKLLLQSSARKDDSDKVEVRVSISNTSKLPVYVKISNDDSVSPRVNIASKTGSVKVYK